VEGRAALAVVAEPAQERLQIKGIGHIGNEPGQVLLGKPVIQGWGQQEELVRIVVPKVVSHTPPVSQRAVFKEQVP